MEVPRISRHMAQEGGKVVSPTCQPPLPYPPSPSPPKRYSWYSFLLEAESTPGPYYLIQKIFIHSFIPLACAEFDDSLPFSGASSIPLCYVLFPATLPHQLFFHPLSPHLAIYFLVSFSILFQNSYVVIFWEFSFLPFSVHVQTSVIYLNLLSLL